MEVATAPPPSTGNLPFRDHDVREWSRINTLTGALERARLETDNWSATSRNASHHYGKVVDSRARTGANGSLQAQASRQLEVFQSRAAGAQLQVVKTTTVSSSKWSGKEEQITRLGFEDLQLPLNPLDLTSQKSKASLGRSAHRRPPSRHPKNQNFTSSTFASDLHSQLRNVHQTAAANLHRVSRLCHQIHESAVRNAFGRKSPSISSRGSADGSASGVEITEIESSSATSNSDQKVHTNLTRTKSISSEDFQHIPEREINSKVESEDCNQLQDWRRNSKIRRSLPFATASSPTNSIDLPENRVSVKKLKEELEKGRRLTTALRNNSISADLNVLDSLIQSISSTSSSVERGSMDDNLDDFIDNHPQATKSKPKRESFVTVESLQEIKGRLRRTSSSGNDMYNDPMIKEEDSDDGIGNEDRKLCVASTHSQVKSYIYGMESKLENKSSPLVGTGSLESRSKLANGTNTTKSEDWFNRRKSYGFEKVHGTEEASAKTLKDKTFVESSTDSGICRSSEIMVIPTAKKTNISKDPNGQYGSESESDVENKFRSISKTLNGINYGNVKKMTSIFNQEDKGPLLGRSCEETVIAWNRRLKDKEWKRNELKSTTITIPIAKNNNIVDLSWNDETEKVTKRHSIALDGSDDNYYRKDFPATKNDDISIEDGIRKSSKKVEFCKTEVHFAAESGKVNIVETDEKPPPTQNFRRRRRNLTDYPEDLNKNGLPMLHFGDSLYEKSMFGVSEDQEVENINTKASEEEQHLLPSAFSVVTVNRTKEQNNVETSEEERKDTILDNDNLKGILKNKPLKPKPYHLGETEPLQDSDEDSNKWGVRLRHIPRENPTIWKSTITVRNSYQNHGDGEPRTNDLPEFQKLLQNLRPTVRKPDYLSDNENRYSDSFTNIRVVPASKDSRRSSWSVSDQSKLDDEIQGNKGYLTKVNFGEGQATVIQNDQSTWPRTENLAKEPLQDTPSDPQLSKATYSIHANSSKYSPIVLRKTTSLNSTEPQELIISKNAPSQSYIGLPIGEFRNLPDPSLQAKCVSGKAVLRQPRQSEMTYFGVGTKAEKTVEARGKAGHKPDLLENHKRAASPKGKRVAKPRKPTPEKEIKDESEHIYENVNPANKANIISQHTENNDFDSAILAELTKAADQILQAVNGYTSEDYQNRLSSDEEDDQHKVLDTISETRSWKNCNQSLELRSQQCMRPTLASAAKIKVKRTSSTSSIDSLSKDRRKAPFTERKGAAAPTASSILLHERSKKKINNEVGSAKSSTKARRLQRASSREVLLQSHGSSSEDLPTHVEVPVRKPRLIKKTKAAQLTVSSGIELKRPLRKSREEKGAAVDNSKNEARILGSLPEIRHKTAISTITSTTEKCSRDRSKTRNEERQTKKSTRKESSGKGTISSSSTRRTSTSSKAQSQTRTSRESGVTQHRISTANIKRCN